MNAALTILDDFIPVERARIIREEVLTRGFKDIPFMHGLYQGTNMEYQPPDMVQSISDFFDGREIKVHVSAFRAGHKDTKLHVNIHADNTIGQWAGVYYLSLPEDCRGGTAFWKMKGTEWQEMPTQQYIEENGISLEWIVSKWTKPEDWDMISLAGMKFNRFIMYPTKTFHSRFPLQGWGEPDELEHARLVWVVFFDVL